MSGLDKLDLTASAFVFHKNKVLLIHHKKFDKWLPPGGHIDPNETPDQAAIREVKEETGLSIEIIPNHDFDSSIASPLPVEANVHEAGDHLHHNQAFAATTISANITTNERELNDFKWVSYEEIPDSGLSEYLQTVTKKAFKAYEQHIDNR